MKSKRKSARGGTIAVFSGVFMVITVALVAFAVDTGFVVHARTDLHRTADAIALAAVQHLPDEASALEAVTAMATEYNSKQGTIHFTLDPADVEFGYWDRDAATFSTTPPTGQDVNAARVTLRRTAAAGDPLSLFFAPVLGVTSADVTATATAMFDHDLCGPLVGIEWVSVPGSPDTDSYNSSHGPYDAATARDRGGLCSDGPINVDGAASVRGSAHAGKGYDVTITGSATVSGPIGSRLKPLNLPPVDASEAAVSNDNASLPGIQKGNSLVSPVDANGNFLLDGAKIYDMPPGEYYFNNFTVEGQSVLNISGPTTIYVTGNMRRAGGTTVNNNTQIPANLKFLMTGGTADVTSNNAFHGVIYAPETAITVDGASDMYGGVVGRTLTITGSGAIHYDEALGLDSDFPRRTCLVD